MTDGEKKKPTLTLISVNRSLMVRMFGCKKADRSLEHCGFLLLNSPPSAFHVLRALPQERPSAPLRRVPRHLNAYTLYSIIFSGIERSGVGGKRNRNFSRLGATSGDVAWIQMTATPVQTRCNTETPQRSQRTQGKLHIRLYENIRYFLFLILANTTSVSFSLSAALREYKVMSE